MTPDSAETEEKRRFVTANGVRTFLIYVALGLAIFAVVALWVRTGLGVFSGDSLK